MDSSMELGCVQVIGPKERSLDSVTNRTLRECHPQSKMLPGLKDMPPEPLKLPRSWCGVKGIPRQTLVIFLGKGKCKILLRKKTEGENV